MAQEKIILGFVGEMVSGKGTVCKYLQKKHNAGYHRFSTILRDVLDRLHKEESRGNMQKLSTMLRKHFGQNLLAKVISEDVKKDKHKIIVVDGIRRFSDIKYLKKIKGFKLVYIVADLKIRYERLIRREENPDDKIKSFNQFKKDQKQESEREILKVGKTADFIIDNNKGYKALYKEVEEILKKLK